MRLSPAKRNAQEATTGGISVVLVLRIRPRHCGVEILERWRSQIGGGRWEVGVAESQGRQKGLYNGDVGDILKQRGLEMKKYGRSGNKTEDRRIVNGAINY
ncbi:uncharacterized protein N7511_010580 [Penicillium nucicola]|uniref:uncharacterized protein n=1 Tax=Penicillium nucicola TaxID=1850975 RepID=UPI0025451E15|nr:uncharacterized protein N7511_010580 [Penicillium nucicola]KAJ5748884.1 hypothetical protein N7511_010580 [Penicillium nucicola]